MLRAPIQTERLIIRQARPGDADLLFAMFNNWNVVQWLARPEWPVMAEGVRAYLEEVSQPDAAEDYRVLEIDGLPVGGISTSQEGASPQQSVAGLHIGYWLGEPFWGQGLMSEAVKGLVLRQFSDSAVPAIYSGVFEGNPASLKIQEKLGFVVESRTSVFCVPQQKDLAHVNTVLTRQAFNSYQAFEKKKK